MKDAMAVMGAIAFAILGYIIWLAVLSHQPVESILGQIIDYLSTPVS